MKNYVEVAIDDDGNLQPGDSWFTGRTGEFVVVISSDLPKRSLIMLVSDRRHGPKVERWCMVRNYGITVIREAK